MNRSSRKILAVMIVTAALCADRAVAAAPALRPAVGDIASGFVDRLARNLGRNLNRSTCQVIFRQVRSACEQTAVCSSAAPALPVVRHFDVSPFQFRLPPPVC